MAAHRLQKRLKLWDLDISIENAKGSSRHWHDPHSGESGSTKMLHDYGYIRGTEGTDGDHVDVYVGPNSQSMKVFVIDQMKKPDFKKFDEQKCMLGFDSAEAAKAAYLKHYNDRRFFGSMREMTMDDFKAKVLDKAYHGKKVAALARMLTEVNLAKLASGDQVVTALPKAPGDRSPGVSILPAVTNFSQATHTQADEHKADQQMKSASEGRAGHIADRLDDVGIGMLAAPYAADAASKGLMRVGGRNAKVRAAATALRTGFGAKSHFGHSTARELTGLALVAPGVTHTVAKRIDKSLPQKTASGDMLQYFADHPEKLKEKQERDRKKQAALEKIAAEIHPDFEYMTESEKTAFLGMLGRMAGTVARAGGAAKGAVTGAGQAVSQGAGRAAGALQGAVQRAGNSLKGGFVAGQRGVSQQVGQRAVQMSKTPGSLISKAPAVKPPASVAAGGIPVPVPTSTAAPGRAGKWNPLSGRNLALGGLAAGGGVAAYGAYKGIQTGAHLLQSQHTSPMALPGTPGIGRVF